MEGEDQPESLHSPYYSEEDISSYSRDMNNRKPYRSKLASNSQSIHSRFIVHSHESSPQDLRRYISPPPGFGNKNKVVSFIDEETEEEAEDPRGIDFLIENQQQSDQVIQELKKEVEHYKNIHSNSTKELTKYQLLHQELLKNKEELHSNPQELEQKLMELFDTFELKYSKIDKLSMCAPVQMENESLKEQLNKTLEDNKHLSEDYNALLRKYQEEVTDNDKLKGQVTKLKVEIERLSVFQSIPAKSVLASSPFDRSKEGIFTDSMLLHAHNQQLQSFKEQYEAERESILLEKSELEQLYVNSNKTHDMLKGKIKKLKEEMKNKETQISELQEYIRNNSIAQAEMNKYFTQKYKQRKQILKQKLETFTQELTQKHEEDQIQIRNLVNILQDRCPQELTSFIVTDCMSCIKLREDLDVKIKSEEELQHYIRTTSEQNLKEIQQKDAERKAIVENYEKTIADLKLKLENIKINLNEERDMRSIVYPGAKSLRSLIENQQMVDRWWRRVAGIMGDIDWVREGNKLVDKSGVLIQEVIQSKPASAGSAGRDVRRRIHQQVITIERKFGEMLKESFITSYKVNEVKELFLELPYLIKPLFDLMKDYESQATPHSSPLDSNPIILKLQKENEECLNKLRYSDSLLSKILSILNIKNKNPEERAKKLSADYAQLEKKCSTLKRENDSLKSKVQELQSKIQKFVTSI